MKKLLLLFTFITIPLYSFSEDIELYIGDSNQRSETKPQVLLIVDTSGSMLSSQTIKTPYDASLTYKSLGAFPDKGNDYHYYVVGTSNSLPAVDDINENRRFLANINNCSTAISRLNTVGFYTGRIREYSFDGNTGSWQEISNADGAGISIIDCEDDVSLDLSNIANNTALEHNKNTVDGTSAFGYPIDGAGTVLAPVYYDTDITKAETTWGGDVVTIYTDNYLRWDQGTKLSNNTDIGTTNTTRLAIAQRTLVNLIDSIPSVQFGIQVYNINHTSDGNQNGPHGGRIAFGIQEITAKAKSSIFSIIEDDLHGSGLTPLCESYYEAYRYFAGLSVLYGDQDVNLFTHKKNKPSRDKTIESGGNYISPYVGCSNEVFVILITDGFPSADNASNSFVKDLQTDDSTAVAVSGNHLPILAEYMHGNDINPNLDGTQIATLYTVGFSAGASSAIPLLESAATHGGGAYYDATDPTKLGSSLQEALSSILEVTTTFTAPSVATNSFDRTETQDSAYYGMFIPGSGAKWEGNLKKLKLSNNQQVDREGEVAIGSDGTILASAKTFWASTTGPDGNNVGEGGVVGMFNNKDTARSIYSNISTGNVLSPLTYTSMVNYYGGNSEVVSSFGSTNIAEAGQYLYWALGLDVNDKDNDGDVDDYRPDLFGDPLHSKPVAINYGGSEDNPDIRIVVGTNSGVLHMFKDSGDTVDESWAFMPKQFFSNIKILRDNLPASGKVYGVDGPITAFTVDSDGDGTISGASDKAWVFFGLRRGGTSYYALDVTNPDAPEYMWEIKANTGEFKELGQTWSQPKIGYSKLNIVGGVPKPVLVFGAGYSIAKDASGPGTNDNVGRGIYMVDAETGTLLWSITPEATSGKNTQFTGFTDSIPSDVSTLDSDSDGLIDRLYVGDTGGNVFRIDMPGVDPFDSTMPWTAFKLAKLGGVTNADDRRFFNAPSIVRTFFTDTVETTIDGNTTITSKETPYDAILLGSGDRSTPTAIDTNDKFFMLQDENIITQSFVSGAVAPALEPPAPILFNDTFLHDFTDNPYDSLTGTAEQALDLIVSQKSGWYFNYSTGEKSTASALVVRGTAIFTSFEPGSIDGAASCSLATGMGFLYTIDLYDGTTAYDSRKTAITATMPDTPTIAITGSQESNTLPSDPSDPPGKDRSNILILTGAEVPLSTNIPPATFSTYQYITEQ